MAIDELERFVPAGDFGSYLEDRPQQLIAERLLIVIGESAARIQRAHPGALEHAGRMIGLRNRVVHDYATIDQATIFVIIKEHIPALKKEVQDLLREHG